MDCKILFEKIKQDVLKTGANVFRIALFKDGCWQDETLRPSCPCLNSYSLSKNFTATAIGMAQDLGLLSVDDPIVRFFPEELPDKMDGRMERVTIRHLLTQTMGSDAGYLFEGDRYTYGTDDWIRLILSKPLAHKPGTTFTYSNSTYYLLSCIIHRASGMTLERFLRQHLFRHVGINEFAWESCPKGETMGATGLYMATPDIAKLGMLYLSQGEYNGRRLLSHQWAEEAVQTHATSPDGRKYGFGFWIKDACFLGGGAHNQVLLVLPGRNAVFAAHSFTDDPCDFADIVARSMS